MTVDLECELYVDRVQWAEWQDNNCGRIARLSATNLFCKRRRWPLSNNLSGHWVPGLALARDGAPEPRSSEPGARSPGLM